MKKQNIVLGCLGILFICGCITTTHKAFQTQESQIQLRSIQSRSFDTSDKNKMMRNVISALQDLDFVIDSADEVLGSVTATKYINNNSMKVSVTTRPKNEIQLIVRMNAQYGIKTIEDPEPYQDFFTVLEKSIFLTAHSVD